MKQIKKVLILCVIMILALTVTGCCISHEWQEATCELPKTCAKCGKTDGEPLGHDPSEWIVKKDASIVEPGLKVKECKRCQEILEEEKTIIPVYKDEKFQFSGDEFAERLSNALNILDDDARVLDAKGASNMVSIGVFLNNTQCLVIFTDPGFQTIGGRTNKNLHASVVTCLDAGGGDKYDIDLINTAVIMACGDNIDEGAAEVILHDIQKSDRAIKQGDLMYTTGKYDKYDCIMIGFFN